MADFVSFPTRTIEDYFNVEDLEKVTERLFLYLSATYPSIDEVVRFTSNGSVDNYVTFNWDSSSLVIDQFTPGNTNYFLEILNVNTSLQGIYPITNNLESQIFIDPSTIHSGLVFQQTGLNANISTGTNSKLRDINFIDLLNQNLEQDFSEPYFFFADISDKAEYGFSDPLVEISDGVIDTSSNTAIFTSNSLDADPDELVNHRLVINNFENQGIYRILSNTSTQISVQANFSPEIRSGISAKVVDYRQGNILSNPLDLTGRGSLSIELESEDEGSSSVHYKISITTLPVFLNWAYFVINYLKTGSYV